ncbi:hypothetical protein ACS0TY_006450 [Phlomoides rotata]
MDIAKHEGINIKDTVKFRELKNMIWSMYEIETEDQKAERKRFQRKERLEFSGLFRCRRPTETTSSKNPGKAPIEEPPREPEKNFYLKQKESNECYVAELQKYWIYRECGMLGTFLSLTGLRESANLAFLQKHMGATCFKNLRLLGGFETLESGEMGHWCLKDENEKVPVPELMEQIASVTGVLSEQQRLVCHDSIQTTIFHSCLCFFNSLLQDSRRLYAPGRLYHIVERKPFRWFFMDLSPTFTDEVNLIKVINIPLISPPEAKIAGDGERLTRMPDEILASLGSLMASHSPPLDALVVRSEDYHQSECVSAMDKRHKFVSGFMSSSGLALITANKALLWTDGRYFLQAEHQLSNKWKLMRTCR